MTAFPTHNLLTLYLFSMKLNPLLILKLASMIVGSKLCNLNFRHYSKITHGVLSLYLLALDPLGVNGYIKSKGRLMGVLRGIRHASWLKATIKLRA
jgi:hypothetical protein